MPVSDFAAWWIAAGLLVAAEMFTGTFYLLMLAIGMTAGAVAAHLGLSQTAQMAAAAIVSALVAGVWIRRHWHVDLAYSSSRPFLSTVGPRERAARAHTDAVPPDGAASESPFASPD